MNTIVGDTIDRSEKIKFRLFPDVKNDGYEYAVCFMNNDQLNLRVHKTDSTFIDLPYNTDLLLKDSDVVWKNQFNQYTEPKTNFKKILITVKDRDYRKGITLRKRKIIQLKLKNHNDPFRARIKQIPSSSEPSILISKEVGNKQLIPVADIEYIYKYKRVEYTTWKVTGALYLLAGILMIAEDYDPGVYFVTSGIIPFLFRNRKLMIGNSDIKVVYK